MNRENINDYDLFTVVTLARSWDNFSCLNAHASFKTLSVMCSQGFNHRHTKSLAKWRYCQWPNYLFQCSALNYSRVMVVLLISTYINAWLLHIPRALGLCASEILILKKVQNWNIFWLTRDLFWKHFFYFCGNNYNFPSYEYLSKNVIIIRRWVCLKTASMAA